jgi:hypothetical protein
MTRHSDPEVLEALDLAWDSERGFLGRLRKGHFSEGLGEEYLDLLGRIEIDEGEQLHPDFVRLVWFAPLSAEWQTRTVVELGADLRAVARIADLIRERVMELLGVP